MKISASTPEEYIEQLPEERKEAFIQLRNTINQHIPKGFKETISYGMIGWVVPHETYPDGYHCSPELPLPFLSIASQKNFIGLYHSGIYADNALYNWFQEEYKKRVPTKLDMGKSCVRLKKPEHIPFDLIAELVEKMTVEQWIAKYEDALKPKSKT